MPAVDDDLPAVSFEIFFQVMVQEAMRNQQDFAIFHSLVFQKPGCGSGPVAPKYGREE